MMFDSVFEHMKNNQEHAEAVLQWEKEQDFFDYHNKIKKIVPEAYLDKTFDSFIADTPATEELKESVKNFTSKVLEGKFYSLVLLGSFGIGKTHLSNSAILEVMKHKKDIMTFFEENGKQKVLVNKIRYSARYILADELIERYENARSFSVKESQTDVLEEFIDCDFLVVDEIGMSTKEELEKEIIYRITNGRDLKKKSFIYISNLNFQEFSKRLGGASMDRLKNSAIFPVCTGINSYRGIKK